MRKMYSKSQLIDLIKEHGGVPTPESLANVLEGSDNIVIDENVEGNKLQARLDVTDAENGDVLTFNEGVVNWAPAAGGGTQLYLHDVEVSTSDDESFSMNFVSNFSEQVRAQRNYGKTFNNGTMIIPFYVVNSSSGYDNVGMCDGFALTVSQSGPPSEAIFYGNFNRWYEGVLSDYQDMVSLEFSRGSTYSISDTVTAL